MTYRLIANEIENCQPDLAGWLTGGLMNLVAHPFGFLGSFTPKPLSCIFGCSQIKNRIFAYENFLLANALVSSSRDRTLAELCRETTFLCHYKGIWVTEGIGFHFTQSRLQSKKQIVPNDGSIEDHFLTPIHTGVGLAIARKCVAQSDFPTIRWVEKASNHFVRLCFENALDGYVGACLEGLGLCVALLRPILVLPFGEFMERLGPRFARLYWHGVGRGIYFSPACIWGGIAPASQARNRYKQQVLSGYAWAKTLVNLRQLYVVNAMFSEHGINSVEANSMGKGVCAALLIWKEWSQSNILHESIQIAPFPTNGHWNESVVFRLKNIANGADPCFSGDRPDLLFEI